MRRTNCCGFTRNGNAPTESLSQFALSWLGAVSVVVFTISQTMDNPLAGAEPQSEVSFGLPRVLDPEPRRKSDIRELRAAIGGSTDPNERALLRIKLARELARPRNPTDLDLAIEAARYALREATDHDAKAEANWALGNLHEYRGRYKLAISFYQEILDRCPNTPIETIYDKKCNRYATLHRMAGCYAAMGDPSSAVDAYVRVIPWAKDEKYQRAAIMRLLDYEPRVALWAHRLPESDRERLVSIARNSKFIATLAAAPLSKVGSEPITIVCDVRGWTKPWVESYRLHYRVWHLPPDERLQRTRKGRRDTAIHWEFRPIVGVGIDSPEGPESHVPFATESRPWLSSPPFFHQALWEPRFRSEWYPIHAEKNKASADAVQATGIPDHAAAFDKRARNLQAQLVLRGLPAGRYLVSVPALELKINRERFYEGRSVSVPFFSSYNPVSFVWCDPVEIELPKTAP